MEVEYENDNELTDDDCLEVFDDDDLQTCEQPLDDNVNTIFNHNNNNVNEIESDDDLENIDSKTAISAFHKLNSYFKKNNGDLLSKMLSLETDLYRTVEDTKKQTLITNFFLKQ